MDLWNKLTGELIDIIEWIDDSNDTLVWRFERYENEIKNGAKLVVRQQQVAIFVNEGQIADVFSAGTYELTTQNLPILTTLEGWKYGFHSPFKAEVYFINLRTFTDNKWGTQNPVMLRDAEFGPVRIRAFGNFTFKVTDPRLLLTEIVGTDGHFTLAELDTQFKALVVSGFSDAIAESRIPILDMAANYTEVSNRVCERLAEDFRAYGLSIIKFVVENISLPPNVEEALDKRSSMGLLGDLNKYTQYQTANALEAAAKNPGGEASSAMGIGMGFAAANQISQAMGSAQSPNNVQATNNAQAAPVVPPALPGEINFFVALHGKQAGPFPLAELTNMARAGQLDRRSLVWTQGMAAWEKAGEVALLQSLFESLPPPIPGV